LEEIKGEEGEKRKTVKMKVKGCKIEIER